MSVESSMCVSSSIDGNMYMFFIVHICGWSSYLVIRVSL